MTQDGTIEALALLMGAYEHVSFSPRVRARVKHAIDRFDQPLEVHLFGDSRMLVPDSEEAAMNLLKSTAQDLEDAGSELDHAAEWLRNMGRGNQASRMKMAANRAHAAAAALGSA